MQDLEDVLKSLQRENDELSSFVQQARASLVDFKETRPSVLDSIDRALTSLNLQSAYKRD